MPTLAYLACTATSLLCCYLLFRGFRLTRTPLLLWSAVCFAGLTLDNVALVLDTTVFPDYDLSLWRSLPGLVGATILLYGLITDCGQ